MTENIKKIRQMNLAYLSLKYKSRLDFAKKLGYKDANYLNQIIVGHAQVGNSVARKIEEIEGLESNWLSTAHHELWDDSPLRARFDAADIEKLSNYELASLLLIISEVLKSRSV